MTQLLKFKIPQLIQIDNADLARNMKNVVAHWVAKTMEEWAAKHPTEYYLHVRDNGVYVEFVNNASISQFLLTYQPPKHVHATSFKRITVVDAIDNTDSDIKHTMRTAMEHSEDTIASFYPQSKAEPWDDA